MEQFVVSAIKYRPLTFASVVGQSSIGTTLKNAIQRGHLSHAYLFCGPRGVGKTTCARIFAKTINCLNPSPELESCGVCESCKSFAEGRSYSIHELDAASNNSVEDIRSLIEQVRIPPQIGKYSLYIIDEVHMLSSAAFNAFLKTLEEPPAHAIFILATTEKHKILPTILSRCQIYDFNRITIEDTISHLETIAQQEGVSYEIDALNIIARKSDGAMRDALSIFDRVVSFCGSHITYKAVIEDLNVLDYDYYFKLTDAFMEGRYADACLLFDEILRKGFDAFHFVSGLSAHFRDLLMCKDPRTIKLLEVGTTIAESYKTQAVKATLYFLFEAMKVTNMCELGFRTTGNPRLHTELALLNISNIGLEKKNEYSEPVETAHQAKPTTENKTVPEKPVVEKELPMAPASISLKNILAGKTTETVVAAVSVQAPVEIKQFTEDQMVEEWRRYVDQLKNSQPRMYSVLQEYTPQLKSDNVITYPVMSENHRQLLGERAQGLITHLRQSLQNLHITIDFQVGIPEDSTDKDGKKRLYTQQDRLKFLIEKNPLLEEFRQEFDMDFR